MPLIKYAANAKLTLWLLRVDTRNHQTDNNSPGNFISQSTISFCQNDSCHSYGSGNPAFPFRVPVFALVT